jgi:hypothetical protein
MCLITTQPCFIDNWRTLSEELKLRILEYTVTLGPPYRNRLLSYYHINEIRYWNFTAFCERIIPLLSIPEIKSLVQEAFYTQHSFEVNYDRKWNTDSKSANLLLHLPPAPIRKYVRRLHVVVNGVDIKAFELLNKAPSAMSNLSNLRFLEISFHQNGRKAVDKHYLDSVQPLRFAVKCLRIAYQHYPMARQGPANVFEAALLEKFTLENESGELDCRWTRFTAGLCEHRLREVESWAAAAAIDHYVRWTVKETFANKGRHGRYPKFLPEID